MIYNKAYESTLPQRMLSYFSSCEGNSLPSFAKFAAASGYSCAQLRSFCQESEDFAQAYEECRARLADMIAEGALTKRYDSSFAKFLLSDGLFARGFDSDNDNSEEFKITITVIDQSDGN